VSPSSVISTRNGSSAHGMKSPVLIIGLNGA
jgi:hypothetical protein